MTDSDYERGYQDGKAEGRERAQRELWYLLEQVHYLAKHIAELTEPAAKAARRERELEPVRINQNEVAEFLRTNGNSLLPISNVVLGLEKAAK